MIFLARASMELNIPSNCLAICATSLPVRALMKSKDLSRPSGETDKEMGMKRFLAAISFYDLLLTMAAISSDISTTFRL